MLKYCKRKILGVKHMKDILYEIKTEPFHISPEHTLSPMPHIHKEIELIYIIDGDCTVRIDQKLLRNFTSVAYKLHTKQIDKQCNQIVIH